MRERGVLLHGGGGFDADYTDYTDLFFEEKRGCNAGKGKMEWGFYVYNGV